MLGFLADFFFCALAFAGFLLNGVRLSGVLRFSGFLINPDILSLTGKSLSAYVHSDLD